jgi:hypothetical protein
MEIPVNACKDESLSNMMGGAIFFAMRHQKGINV